MEKEVSRAPTLAQDLIAPMAVVRQLAFCLEPGDREQTEEFRQKIILVAERGLEQIHNLERLSRIEAGEIEMEAVDARAVMEEVREETREFFICHKKRLRLEYRGRTRLVAGNRELLNAVVNNLATSAINYTTESGELVLRIYYRKGTTRFELRDFGPIIPQAISAEISEKRARGPIRIPLRPDVSGLGMYLNVRFLDAMGAGIRLVRHKDGMSFWFELKSVDQGRLF